MKLFIVTNSLASGGKERQIIELVKILNANNVNYKVICFSKEINVTGIEHISEKLLIIDRKKGDLKAQMKYFTDIREYKPDIVHVWDNHSALMSVFPKIIFNFKLIDGSIRGARRYLKRIVYMSLTFPFTSIVVANSFAGLRSTYRRAGNRNIVIYNGFDFNRINKLDSSFDLKESFQINNKKIVGMTANIRAAKDYNGFIKVAEMILKERTDIAFVSLGYGKISEDILQSLDPKIRNGIYFIGNVDTPEEYIKSFDIGLLLNDIRYGMEGISNAIMEYMAQSIPVIATNAGGTPEIVIDGENGYLVPPFNYILIVQKILFLIENEEKRIQMGIKGKKVLEDKFSKEKMKNEYLNMYNNLLNIKKYE